MPLAEEEAHEPILSRHALVPESVPNHSSHGASPDRCRFELRHDGERNTPISISSRALAAGIGPRNRLIAHLLRG